MGTPGSYRQLDGTAQTGAGAPAAPEPSVVDALRAEGAAALEQALDTIGTVTTGLEDEVATAAQADRAFIEALRGIVAAAAAAATVPPASAGRPACAIAQTKSKAAGCLFSSALSLCSLLVPGRFVHRSAALQHRSTPQQFAFIICHKQLYLLQYNVTLIESIPLVPAVQVAGTVAVSIAMG